MKTGAVGAPRDYFNPFGAVQRTRAWGLLGSESSYALRFVTSAVEAATGANNVCSVLLPWHHLRWLVRLVRADLTRASGVDRPDSEVLAELIPGPRYLHLRCGDLKLQALRWYLGERQLEHVGKPRLSRNDFQQVRWLETTLEKHERGWASFFGLHGLEPIVVEQESFFAQPDETVREILDWLGVTGSAVPGWEAGHPYETGSRADLLIGRYLSDRESLGSEIGVRAKLV